MNLKSLALDPQSFSESFKFNIVELDPTYVVPWHMANRLNTYITDESCEELIESIKSVGQQIPALVRKTNQLNHYELICGARRLFVCKKLGIKLLAAIVDFTDKEALLAMDAENRPRNDISPYERALDYKNWIETGIYTNQTQICKAIGIKKSLFTQIFSLSAIDESIVSLFGHPNNLSIKWGYQLAKACKNTSNKQLLLNKVEELKKQKLKPSAVYSSLLEVLRNETKSINKSKTTTYISSKSSINLMVTEETENASIQLKNIKNKSELQTVLNFLKKELGFLEKPKV